CCATHPFASSHAPAGSRSATASSSYGFPHAIGTHPWMSGEKDGVRGRAGGAPTCARCPGCARCARPRGRVDVTPSRTNQASGGEAAVRPAVTAPPPRASPPVVDEVQLHALDDGLGAAAYVELAVDGRDVVLHGLLGEEQLRG